MSRVNRWVRQHGESVRSLLVRTWHPSFDGALDGIIKFLFTRVEWSIQGMDCHITFERLPIDQIKIVSPKGASAPVIPGLKQQLVSSPVYDCVPIVCTRANGATAVHDGHHRIQTYLAAGRQDVPAIVASFTTGTGLVTF